MAPPPPPSVRVQGMKDETGVNGNGSSGTCECWASFTNREASLQYVHKPLGEKVGAIPGTHNSHMRREDCRHCLLKEVAVVQKRKACSQSSVLGDGCLLQG